MPKHELLYLSQQDVINTGLTLAESVELVERALREHGEKQVENPPKPGIHPRGDAFIHAMPSFLRRLGIAGMKWVSGFFANPARGLPSISGLIVLNDPDNGIPTAVMDCAYITALRTAAVSGVAARHLARRDARVLGIVGAGLQGRYNLAVLQTVLPKLASVQVNDVTPEAVERFRQAMAGTTSAEIVSCSTPRQAIEGADVVVTATGWLDEPIFQTAWVQPGALVLPVHARGWNRTAPRDMDRFIVDDWQQFNTSMGQPGGFYHPLPQPFAELSEIVAGAKPGRQDDRARIIDFNYGMAVHDMVMADEVLRRARAKGLGVRLPQLDGVMPLT